MFQACEVKMSTTAASSAAIPSGKTALKLRRGQTALANPRSRRRRRGPDRPARRAPLRAGSTGAAGAPGDPTVPRPRRARRAWPVHGKYGGGLGVGRDRFPGRQVLASRRRSVTGAMRSVNVAPSPARRIGAVAIPPGRTNTSGPARRDRSLSDARGADPPPSWCRRLEVRQSF
jgi:hypothetical protein